MASLPELPAFGYTSGIAVDSKDNYVVVAAEARSLLKVTTDGRATNLNTVGTHLVRVAVSIAPADSTAATTTRTTLTVIQTQLVISTYTATTVVTQTATLTQRAATITETRTFEIPKEVTVTSERVISPPPVTTTVTKTQTERAEDGPYIMSPWVDLSVSIAMITVSAVLALMMRRR